MIWGPQNIPLPLPAALRGSLLIGDVAIAKYRLLAMLVGLVVFVGMLLVLNRTKIGLLIRAGVENREMVESARLPHPPPVRRRVHGRLGARRPRRRDVGAVPQEVHASMGAQVNVLIFIVIIIGGLGSIGGCFIGALLVGLVANYGGFLVPKLALVSNILLMVAILMWRPRGFIPGQAMMAACSPRTCRAAGCSRCC